MSEPRFKIGDLVVIKAHQRAIQRHYVVHWASPNGFDKEVQRHLEITLDPAPSAP